MDPPCCGALAANRATWLNTEAEGRLSQLRLRSADSDRQQPSSTVASHAMTKGAVRPAELISADVRRPCGSSRVSRSVGDDRDEVAAVGREQLAGDAKLAGDNRRRRRSAGMVHVEVAGNPVGVDVKLDRAHGAGGDQRVGKSSWGKLFTGGPDQLPAGGDSKTGSCNHGEALDRVPPADGHATDDRGGGDAAVDE